MCDMIPFAEHWRLSLAEAQDLQHSILGYLPGFATPRIVCDVPFVGKRWVHQADEYDTERGISYWRKNYRTSIEAGGRPRRSRASTSTTTRSTRSPEPGQDWWRDAVDRDGHGRRGRASCRQPCRSRVAARLTRLAGHRLRYRATSTDASASPARLRS